MPQDFPPSTRALATLHQGPAWELMQKVKLRPVYDAQTRPDGIINLSGALNVLMRDWMKTYTQGELSDSMSFESLSYGPLAGSSPLLNAAAGFFNRFFHPSEPILAEHLLAANGVTSLIDMMAWSLCDAGDGVLYPTPNFYMLDYDLTSRAGLATIPVSTTGLKDPFGPDGSTELIEALKAAAELAAATEA